MEPFKVFVSSTSRDLLAERKAVATVLRKVEFPVTVMEDWDAIPADATSVSSDGVVRCEIFVGIYAFRYGFIPPGSASSITEQEYEMARREGKRCLCYFKDESLEAAVDANPELVEPESSRQMLAAFKGRIEKELVRGHFSSSEDLTTKLATGRWPRGSQGGQHRSLRGFSQLVLTRVECLGPGHWPSEQLKGSLRKLPSWEALMSRPHVRIVKTQHNEDHTMPTLARCFCPQRCPGK